ncbi:SWIB/MDM2 domain-containing protein [Sphingomonas sp. 1P08PE]|uniref:SWIB/MDM2 domain-containing protein n=1 Tax=Sphingomonas sp. 1P08PE TaxID=554122 RepID=UPI0039A3D89D
MRHVQSNASPLSAAAGRAGGSLPSDAKDRRRINADDKLQNVFGKMTTSMSEMKKYLSAQLTARKRQLSFQRLSRPSYGRSASH